MLSASRIILASVRCWTIVALWLIANSGSTVNATDSRVVQGTYATLATIDPERELFAFPVVIQHDAHEPMHAMPAVRRSRMFDDPTYIYVIDTGCTRNLFKSGTKLKGVRPVNSVAVNGITGKKYVENIGVHPAIGKTFVASWAGASLISVPQLMSEGCWVLGSGTICMSETSEDESSCRADV